MTDATKHADLVADLAVDHEAILRLAGIDTSDFDAMIYSSDGKPVRRLRDITSPAKRAADAIQALEARVAELEREYTVATSALLKENARAKKAEAERDAALSVQGAAKVLLDAVNRDGLTVFPDFMRAALRAIAIAEGATEGPTP